MIIANLISKNTAKLKEYISLKQNESEIEIQGHLGNAVYEVKSLIFTISDELDPIIIPNKKSGSQFLFHMNLTEYLKQLTLAEGVYNLYLSVKVPLTELPEQKVIKLKTKPLTSIDESHKLIEYPIRLGRFQQTDTGPLKAVNINGCTFTLYKSVKGNLSLAVNQPVSQKNEIQIDSMQTKKDLIQFSGKLFTRSFEVEQIEVLVAGRENNRQVYFQTVNIDHLKEETGLKFGLNRYKYTVRLSLKELFKGIEKDSNVYDVYFKIQFADQAEPVFVKIGKPRFKARLRTKLAYTQINDKVFAISSYYSNRHAMLCLQVEDFERQNFIYLRKLMRWSFLLRPFYKKKDIWVIGELPYKGQDTGFHFFKHVRTAHPEKNAYYVINQNSPDRRNVDPYGNVLFFKTKEHIKAILFANKIIMSHHPDYLYPIRTKEFKKKLRAQIVFLQHGVMGTKNLAAFYSKQSNIFETDLMIVSSEKEKRIVKNDFGYSENEVAITGLSRFDSLLEDNIPLKRQLLIIPTWREWLVREDIFLDSEYLERYRELVFHPKLKELADNYNFEVIFCLHPNMQKFTHLFKDAPYRVISQGEVNVQDLLKESMMMITDYSSVAFDFSFLEKPIIYYQFDRRRFIGKKGSHLNLDKDLPGDIVYEADDILQKVEQYAQDDFKMLDKYRKRASEFLKYKDRNASERIYKVLNRTEVKRSLLYKWTHSEIVKKVYNRFRKSRYYYPSMKLLYKVMKTVLPVDKKLIVFESGVGKQFTDSPRNIYEEIVRQKLNYKKVWIYNKNVRFSDPKNTIQIKRLSPKFFYYLARARVWVNNQNFPTYITKRKGTVYLQTWHGTPLKKMLHDIENVMGRNDTYLERVTASVKRWDYLISPSPYATNAFRSAFLYDGEVIESGYPRNDLFYKENRVEMAADIKGQLNLPKNKKVILYAPTFRDNETSKTNHFTFQIKMDLEKMHQELGDEYIILLRMHVVIKNKISIPKELTDFVVNVSSYPDVQELLLISDILITDYSSIMFDFANTKLPILFFTYDLEAYRDMVRGFYMDFEKEAPGPIVRNTNEIIDTIANLTQIVEKYQDKYDAFYNKYCKLEDGHASERVVDFLLEKNILNNNDNN